MHDATKGEAEFRNNLGTLLAELIAMCEKETKVQKRWVPRYAYVINNRKPGFLICEVGLTIFLLLQ
jgi:hypothetical protein